MESSNQKPCGCPQVASEPEQAQVVPSAQPPASAVSEAAPKKDKRPPKPASPKEFATPSNPGIVKLTGMNPKEARHRIERRQLPKRKFWRPKAKKSAPANVKSAIASNTVKGPDSIAELARALRNDVDLIFEWVYNNIEFTPTYGVQKGALGCLVDGRGNAFDQSMLLVALLTEAGYTAEFVLCNLKVPGEVVTNWLGTAISPAWVSDYVLNYGGIPSSYTWVSPDDLEYDTFSHCWVRVEIDATWYVFDPSLKEYSYTSGIDLANAMDYNTTDYMNDALDGATVDSNYIEGFNRANVRSNLTTCANNLIDYIKTNMPTATLDDVLGGRTIVPVSGPIRDTSHPYQDPETSPTNYEAIPNGYRTTLRVEVGDIDITFYSDEIYPHRLTLTWNGSIEPVLSVGGVVAETGSAVTEDTWQFLTTTITHNAYTDPSVNQSIGLWVWADRDMTTLIGHSWGTAGRGPVDYHTKLFYENTADGAAPEDEPVMGERLAVIWANYNSLASASHDIVSRIGKCSTVHIHNVGLVQYLNDTDQIITVSDWGAMYTTLTLNGVDFPTQQEACAQAVTMQFGTLEGLSISMSVDIDNVSAARMIDTSVANGDKIFYATSSNWSTDVQPNITGYSGPEQTIIEDNYLDFDWELVLPEDGSLVWQDYQGDGFLAIAFGATNGGIIHYINGGLKGGASAQSGPGEPPPEVPAAPPPDRTSPEPIDMFTGSYLYQNVDMTVGSQPFPYGLSFKRSYNSANYLADGTMGLGWGHNFLSSAHLSSDGFQGLGEDSPIDAAASIAQMYVCFDLLNENTRSLGRWIALACGLTWWVDQMWHNTVVVASPGGGMFTKLPDGSYNPPPNNANTLTLTDDLYTLTTPQQTALNFDSDGNLDTWVFPAGMTVSLTYTDGKLTSIDNNLGRTLTLTYTDDKLTSVSDGNDRTVSYEYDGDNNLVTFTNALDKDTTYAYDGGKPGLLTQIFRPAHPMTAIVTNVYDSLNRVETQSNARDQTWTYYFAGARSEEVDPLEDSHILHYDRFGRVVRDIDALGNETTFEYDGLSRLINKSLPEGNSFEYEYDAKNNLLTVTAHPKPGSLLDDIVTSFTYDPDWNKVATSTDGEENTTTYSYDPEQGTLLTIERPEIDSEVPTVTYTWNEHGQILTRTDETEIVTSYNYDEETEKLLSVVVDYGSNPHLNLTTNFDYDDVGNRTSVEDPNENTTTFEFDDERQLLLKTDPTPFEYVTNFDYDDNGNLTTIERQTGGSPSYQTYTIDYTVTGKRSTVTDPLSNVSTWTYDDKDRLETFTDAELREWQFAYDELDRLYTVTDPSTTVSETRTYTDNGKPYELTDARSNTTSFSYDGFDRLERTTYADSTYEENQDYDANGNVLTQLTRSGDSIVNTFDVLNRLSTKAPDGQATVTFGYDLAGRRTSISTPTSGGNPATGTFEFAFDTAGRFYQETTPDTNTCTYDLDNNGNIIKITYPDSYYVERFYDEMNRLTSIKLNGSMTPALEFDYDDLSRRTALTYGNGAVVNYGYEINDDMTSLEQVFNGSASVTFGYGFNDVHQETSRSVDDSSFLWHLSSGGTTSYATANDLNQYPSVASISYSYDDNGNLTGDGTWAFGYDIENHLTSASKSGTSATYVYDGLHRQIQKTVNSTSTRFYYAGWQRIADYNGSTLLTRYIYGARLDEPLIAVASGGTLTYLHHDRIRSIIATTNSGGSVTNTNKFSPFGEGSVSGTSFGFTGQRYDSESGLYYYKRRYYSPTLGRFLQRDPLGLDCGCGCGGSCENEGSPDELKLNLYAYVANDPLNKTDSTGLAADGHWWIDDPSDDWLWGPTPPRWIPHTPAPYRDPFISSAPEDETDAPPEAQGGPTIPPAVSRAALCKILCSLGKDKFYDYCTVILEFPVLICDVLSRLGYYSCYITCVLFKKPIGWENIEG